MKAYVDSTSCIDSSARSIYVFEPYGDATYPTFEPAKGRCNPAVDKAAKPLAPSYSFCLEGYLFSRRGADGPCGCLHGNSPSRKCKSSCAIDEAAARRCELLNASRAPVVIEHAISKKLHRHWC
jgi:hypothetical protein